MTEMIFQSGQSLPIGNAGQSKLVPRIRDLREELNWYYHRIELEQLRPEESSSKRLQQWQKKRFPARTSFYERFAKLSANELENATLEAPADFSLARLQLALPMNTTLVEYYSTGIGSSPPSSRANLSRLVLSAWSPGSSTLSTCSAFSFQNFEWGLLILTI